MIKGQVTGGISKIDQVLKVVVNVLLHFTVVALPRKKCGRAAAILLMVLYFQKYFQSKINH